MIPIKKIKQKIVAEFNSRSKDFDDRVLDIKFNPGTHYFKIPWGLAPGSQVKNDIILVRYNVKRNCFDRITFNAFGRDHRIHL